jgi:hypothetical protein
VVAPGIEPGTSGSVAGNSDHYTTEVDRNAVGTIFLNITMGILYFKGLNNILYFLVNL